MTDVDIMITNLVRHFLVKRVEMSKLYRGAANRAQRAKQVYKRQRSAHGASGTFAGRRPQLFGQFVFGITPWRLFCTFSSGHSHGRNFALILFKIADEVESYILLIAIENQRDWSVTSANMADRV